MVRSVPGDVTSDPDGKRLQPVSIVVQLRGSAVRVGDVWHEVGFCTGTGVPLPRIPLPEGGQCTIGGNGKRVYKQAYKYVEEGAVMVHVPPAYFDYEENVLWLWLLRRERSGTFNVTGTMARIDYKLEHPTAVLATTFSERNCGYYPIFTSVRGDALTVDHFAYEGHRHARSTLAQGTWTTEYLESMSPEDAATLHRRDQDRLRGHRRACGVTYRF
jgi:hypothetical protein